MIKPTERVYIDTKVGKPMKETGLMICSMEWEQRFWKTDQNIQENSEMGKNTEWGNTPGQTARTIKVNGIKI